MARKKGSAPSLSSYFRHVYHEHPEWLGVKTNDLMKERWKQDHNGQEMTSREQSTMANVKSLMRKALRKRRRAAKKDGRMVVAKAGAAISGNSALERLEIAIDHCLSTARSMNNPDLERAVKALRLARNDVVLTLGK